MKFTIWIDPSLVIITKNLFCLKHAPVEKIFKEIHQFYTFYLKITSPLGEGHEIYNILSPYPTDATYQIWLRMAQ